MTPEATQIERRGDVLESYVILITYRNAETAIVWPSERHSAESADHKARELQAQDKGKPNSDPWKINRVIVAAVATTLWVS